MSNVRRPKAHLRWGKQLDSRYRPPRASNLSRAESGWIRYAAILFNAIGICAWLPDLLFQTTMAAIAAPSLGATALQFIDLTFVLPAAAALTALIAKPKWWLVFPALLLNFIVAPLAVVVPAFLGEQEIRSAAQGFSSVGYFVALYIGFALVPSTTSAIALYKRLLS